MASIWDILEIEETKDKNSIKNAYRRKLTRTNPEDYPEEFKELRYAYEQAIEAADALPSAGKKGVSGDGTSAGGTNADGASGDGSSAGGTNAAGASAEETNADGAFAGGAGESSVAGSGQGLIKDESPVGLWMEKVEELYGSFYDRIDVHQWEKLLADDVCVGLESAEEARTQLLKFFMDHIKLPNTIWRAIDRVFDITRDKQELYELFPKDYIDYILRLIKYENFLDYHLFTGNAFADYDAYMDMYFDLRQTVSELKYEEAMKLYDKLLDNEIYHPFIEVERAFIEAGRGRQEQAEALLEPVSLKYPDSFYIGNTYAVLCVENGHYEDARPVFEHLLELKPENYDARLGLARCISAGGDDLPAKEMVLDLLEENPGDDNAMNALKKINEHLIARYEKELDKKPGDLGISLDLGWCLCQNEDYERCLTMLEQLTPDEAHAYDYTNLRGRIYLCLERYGDALPWLLRWKSMIDALTDDGTREYVKRKKRLGYANYAIACSYSYLGEHTNADYYQKALEYVEAAIASETEPRQHYSCIYTKAELLQKLGNDEACIDLCDSLTDEESGFFPAYVLRMEAWLSLGRAQKVVDEYYRAVRIYPYHPRPYELAAQVFLDYQEPKEAGEVLESAEKAGVMNDELRLLKLRCLKNKADSPEDYEAAISYCDEVLAMDEEGRTKQWISQMYRLKAICYMDNGNNEAAMQIIAKAIRENPSDNWNLSVKAEILENMDQDSQALKIYLELISSMPDNAYLTEHAGRIYMRRKDYKKALWYMRKVKALDENFPLIHRSLGMIHKEMIRDGDKETYKQAILEFTAQIETKDSAFDRMERGKLLLAGMLWEEAQEDFQKVLELEPDNKAANLCLGDVFYESGRFEEALAQYEIIMEAAPGARFSSDLFERTAGCCVVLGHFDEAEKYYKLNLEHYPENASAYDLLGNLYIKMKKYDDACSAYIHGMEQNDGEKLYFANKICSLYVALGDRLRARVWWKRILSEKRSAYTGFLGNFRAGQYYLYMEHNFPKAARYLKKSMEAAKNCENKENVCQIQYVLGVLASCMGDTTQAQCYFQSALDTIIEIYGKGTGKIDSLELLPVSILRKMACIYGWLSKGEAMEEICGILKKKSPSGFEIFMARGFLLFAGGDYAAAEEAFRQARDTGGLDVECEGMNCLTEYKKLIRGD